MERGLQFEGRKIFSNGMPDDHIPEARFANTFRIGYNPDEFVLDAGQSFEGEDRFYLRIICSPFCARELCRLLNESLREYRAQYGPIREQEED